MLKSFHQISCYAVIACLSAIPLAAQEATPPESAPDQGLDLGQPVENTVQIGQRYSKDKIGDWDLVCIKTENDEDPCNLFQLLKDQNDGSIAEISLFRIEQSGGQAVAGATLVAPLETLLASGATLSIDGAPGKRYSFNYCTATGCVAQIGLTDGDIAALKQGSEATVSVRPAGSPNTVVNAKMSLKGFTAGYDIVDVVKQ